MAGPSSTQLLLAVAQAMRQNVGIRDRPSGFAGGSAVNCFLGSEAVDWLAGSPYCPSGSRSDAVTIGRQLLHVGLFHHVNDDRDFADKPLLYRFFVDEDRLYKRFWVGPGSRVPEQPEPLAPSSPLLGAAPAAAHAALSAGTGPQQPHYHGALRLPKSVSAGSLAVDAWDGTDAEARGTMLVSSGSSNARAGSDNGEAAAARAVMRLGAIAGRLAAVHDSSLWRIQPHIACNSLALGHRLVDRMHGSLHALSLSAAELVRLGAEAKRRLAGAMAAAAEGAGAARGAACAEVVAAVHRRLPRLVLQHVRLERQLLGCLRDARRAVLLVANGEAVDAVGGSSPEGGRTAPLVTTPAAEWVPLPTRRGRDTAVYQRADGTLHPTYKAVTTIPAPPHAVLAFILFSALRASWDPTLVSHSPRPAPPRSGGSSCSDANGSASSSSPPASLRDVVRAAEPCRGPSGHTSSSFSGDEFTPPAAATRLSSRDDVQCAIVTRVCTDASVNSIDLVVGSAGPSPPSPKRAPQSPTSLGGAGSGPGLAAVSPGALRGSLISGVAGARRSPLSGSLAPLLIAEASEEDEDEEGADAADAVKPSALRAQRGAAAQGSAEAALALPASPRGMGPGSRGGSPLAGSLRRKGGAGTSPRRSPIRRATVFAQGAPGEAPIVEQYFPSPLLLASSGGLTPSLGPQLTPLMQPLLSALPPPALALALSSPPRATSLAAQRGARETFPGGTHSAPPAAAAQLPPPPQPQSSPRRDESRGATDGASNVLLPDAPVASRRHAGAEQHAPPATDAHPVDRVRLRHRHPRALDDAVAERILVQRRIAQLTGGGGSGPEQPLPPQPAARPVSATIAAAAASAAATALSPLHYLAWQLEAELARELPLLAAARSPRQQAPPADPASESPSAALLVPRILHRRVNALSSLMAPRDAVTLQDVGLCRSGGAEGGSGGGGDCLVVYEVSAQHRCVPPAPQGYVRMAVFLEGFVLEPCPGGSGGHGTRVSYVSQVSLRGQLPPWLARTLIDSQTLAPLTALRKALAAYTTATAALRGPPPGSAAAPLQPPNPLLQRAVLPPPAVARPRAGATVDPSQLLLLRRAQLLRAQRAQYDRRGGGAGVPRGGQGGGAARHALVGAAAPGSAAPPSSPSWSAADDDDDEYGGGGASSSEEENADGFVRGSVGTSSAPPGSAALLLGESVSQRGGSVGGGGSARLEGSPLLQLRSQLRRQAASASASVRFRLSVGGAGESVVTLAPAPPPLPPAPAPPEGATGEAEEEWWREAVAELAAYANGGVEGACAGGAPPTPLSSIEDASCAGDASPAPLASVEASSCPRGGAAAAAAAAALDETSPCVAVPSSSVAAPSSSVAEAPGVPRVGDDAPPLQHPAPAPSSEGASPPVPPTPPPSTEAPRSAAAVPPQPQPLPSAPPPVSLEDFELICVLGRGGYGKVLLVRRVAPRTPTHHLASAAAPPPPRDVGALYAMKVLRKRAIIQRRAAGRAMNERRILSRVRHHPFIVSLRYAFQTPAKLYLVMEWAPGGDLFALMSRGGVPPSPSSSAAAAPAPCIGGAWGGGGAICEEQAVLYVAEVTLALAHLHAAGVVYRDLKPENVLLDAAGHVRLADFGLSRYAAGGDDSGGGGGLQPDDVSHSFAGTEAYMAPEMLLQAGHTAAVDFWSLGILTAEMLTGRHPFRGATHLATLQAIVDPDTPPATLGLLPPLAASLVAGLLDKDPARRLGSAAAGGLPALLQHPFFRARPEPGLPPAPLDWRRVLGSDYSPLYVPFPSSGGGGVDVSLFDRALTQEAPVDSVASLPSTRGGGGGGAAGAHRAWARDGGGGGGGGPAHSRARTARGGAGGGSFSAFSYAASSAFGCDGGASAVGGPPSGSSPVAEAAETDTPVSSSAEPASQRSPASEYAAGGASPAAVVTPADAIPPAPTAAAVAAEGGGVPAEAAVPLSGDGYVSEEAEYSLCSSSDGEGTATSDDDGDGDDTGRVPEGGARPRLGEPVKSASTLAGAAQCAMSAAGLVPHANATAAVVAAAATLHARPGPPGPDSIAANLGRPGLRTMAPAAVLPWPPVLLRQPV